MTYWEECLAVALEEAGAHATTEQIEKVADAIDHAHQNYGIAHGHDCIPNPLETENKRLAEQLKKEMSKVICQTCGGTGRIISHGPIHSYNNQCDKCCGEGKHSL